MPRRHNDDIVIPGDGPYPLQRLWEGPAEPRGRLREKRPGNKLLPLVIDRHPEIRYGEDMGQRLRHMSAAEEIHGPRLDQRLGEEGRLILRQQPPAAQQGLQPFHGNFRPPQAPGPVTGPHPPAAPVHGGDQPGGAGGVQQGQRVRQRRPRLAVRRVEILEVHPHVSAADHTHVGHVPRSQPVALEAGFFLSQQFHRHLGGAVLHRAAADGPYGIAVIQYQHLRPRPPGRGAPAGYDAAENGGVSGVQFLQQGGKQSFHGSLLFIASPEWSHQQYPRDPFRSSPECPYGRR